MRRPTKRQAFTLVELLVVMVILGLLLALLLPAIQNAVRAAKDAQISAEIQVMVQALEAFKSKYGDYPPSRIVLSENGNYYTGTGGTCSATAIAPLVPRSVQFLKKFWPRMVLDTTGTSTPGFYDWNGNANIHSTAEAPYVINGAECLVLFLGGIPEASASGFGMTGFAKSPINPAQCSVPSATAGAWQYSTSRDNPFFEFKGERLQDANNNGIPEYYDPTGGQNGEGMYAYFSAYGGVGYDPEDVDGSEADDSGTYQTIAGAFMTNNSPGVSHYKTSPGIFASPAPNPYCADPPVPTLANGTVDLTNLKPRNYINPRSYQIISPGRDHLYGIGGQYLAKATGSSVKLPFDSAVGPDKTQTQEANQQVTSQTLSSAIRQRESDNVTNFAQGKLD